MPLYLKLKRTQVLLLTSLASLALLLILTSLSSQAVVRASQSQEIFDVISIKPVPSPSPGGRGSGGGPCGGLPRISNNRVTISNASVYSLIGWAYGKGECLVVAKSGLISGGPDWVRSDRFEIQAVMPDGTPAYTFLDLRRSAAPKLQAMLQGLLVDRFKLSIHRETKEIPVYTMTIAKGGFKLQPEQEGSCTPRRAPPGEPPDCGNYQLSFGPMGAVSGGHFEALSFLLGMVLDRPVIDKTGITGVYKLMVRFAIDEHVPMPDPMMTPPPPDPNAASIFTAIQEQLGLKLEPGRGTAEMLVIDHIEKPTPN